MSPLAAARRLVRESRPVADVLLRESAPVVPILLFWLFLSSFVRPLVGTGLQYAGVAMVLLYTAVRGLALADAFRTARSPDGPAGVLRESATVALAVGAWFLAAEFVYGVEGAWDGLGLPGAFTSPADALAFALTGAGVAAVLLYAVAVGSTRVRSATSANSDAASADE